MTTTPVRPTAPVQPPAAPALPTSAPPAAAPADPATAAPAPGAFTHRQILTILSGLMLGMFLAALDQNIVSTSIRTIADDLQGLNLQAWATTSYLITATISTPLYGKLSDLYGRKPFFLFAIGTFVVGSVLCTISTSMYELAAFRAVQGLGAGGLMSLALTIIGDIVPPRERARYQGYFLAMFGTSSVVGPVVGGFFAGQDTIIGITGWRWVFLVNVPIGIAAFLVVGKVLNLPHSRRERRIDWPGASALAICLVPVLTVAEQGREWGWTSTASIVCYVVGVLGLVGFVLAERHYGDDALLPPHLFRNGVFSLVSVIGVITGIGMFGGISILPQYLQIVTGSDPTSAGLQMIPLIGGMMTASIVSGQLTSRTGRYKVFPVVGLGLMTVGMLLFHFLLHEDTPYGLVALPMVVFGLGLGNCMQTLTLAVQNAVPAKDMGVATASATFFRQMGGTLGVAVFLSVLFSTVGDSIRSALGAAAADPGYRAALADPAVRADPANAAGLDPLAGAVQVQQDSSVLQRMDSRLAQPFLAGFADSMGLVFLCAAAVVFVGFVLIWFLREIPLRSVSGIQARAAEDGGSEDAGTTDTTDTTGTAGTTGTAVAEPVADGAGDPTPAPATTPTPAPAANPARTPAAAAGTSRPGLTGRVTWPGGVPAPGAVVTVTGPDGAVRTTTRTDDDGRWSVHGSGAGRHTVTVLAAGAEPAAVAGSAAVRPDPLDVELVVARHDVGGVVRGAAGGPVEGALVVLVGRDGAVLGSATTGADGAFAFPGVPAGRHMLTASGFAPVSRDVHVVAPASGPVELTVGREDGRAGGGPAGPVERPGAPAPVGGAAGVSAPAAPPAGTRP